MTINSQFFINRHTQFAKHDRKGYKCIGRGVDGGMAGSFFNNFYPFYALDRGRLVSGWSGSSDFGNQLYFVPDTLWNSKVKAPTKPVATPKVAAVKKEEFTLAQLRAKFNTAHALIGKSITNKHLGTMMSPSEKEMKVSEVILVVAGYDFDSYSSNVDNFYKKHGYVIILLDEDAMSTAYDTDTVIFENVKVRNTSNVEYAGVYDKARKYWVFGCAHISDEIVSASIKLMKLTSGTGDRTVKQINIGVGVFNLETLEKMERIAKGK